MIEFKNITVEGFGSIRDLLTFDFDKGIHIIRGLNGAGKTSIFNALFWCIYGDNLKELTVNQLPTKPKYRTEDFQGTISMVEILIKDKMFVVTRTIEYKAEVFGYTLGTGLFIFESTGKGNLGDFILMNFQGNADTQKFINSLMGMDSKIFLSSILFGQRMKRFIEADPKDKTKIFESIFDLDFIEEYLKKCITKKDRIDAQIKDKTNDYEKLSIKADGLQSRIDKSDEVKKSYEQKKKEKIENIQNQINQLKEQEPIDLQRLIDLGKIPELKPISQELVNANVNIQHAKKEKLRLERIVLTPPKEIVDICNVCSQKLSKDKIKQLTIDYNNELVKHNEAVVQNTKHIEEQNQIIKNNEELEKEFIKLTQENVLIQQKITTYNRSLSEINNKLSNDKNNIVLLETSIKQEEQFTPIFDDVDLLEKEINDISLTQDSLVFDIDVLTTDQQAYDYLIKNCFSAKGLKSYILDASLNLLNESIQKYINRLGFNVRFWIDTKKASKPFMVDCLIDGESYDYKEFSGGEKSKIDVSAAFAIHDLVSSNNKMNILIMDEVFDGMDNHSIEEVFDLIRMKSEDKSLYIITHSEHIDSINTTLINIKKINNTTVIE